MGVANIWMGVWVIGVLKGSICVDGVSLTANTINGAQFELNLVPHTLQETIMDGYRAGIEVNLEVDQIAR
jgi:riboflavin synthase